MARGPSLLGISQVTKSDFGGRPGTLDPDFEGVSPSSWRWRIDRANRDAASEIGRNNGSFRASSRINLRPGYSLKHRQYLVKVEGLYFEAMSRSCTTCQHLKRPEIDRRLAAGEPSAQVARDYELNASSLHRHRQNCLKLASSSVIKKEASRGSAAVALLPSKEALSGAYFELRDRIDCIVTQAEQQGSLKVAITGLNSVRQEPLTAWCGSPATTEPQQMLPEQGRRSSPTADRHQSRVAERLIQRVFDHEPEIEKRGSRRRWRLGTTKTPSGGRANSSIATRSSTAAINAAANGHHSHPLPCHRCRRRAQRPARQRPTRLSSPISKRHRSQPQQRAQREDVMREQRQNGRQ